MQTLKLTLLAIVAIYYSFTLNAGTIFFKNGNKLSHIKIISISDGEIVLEKNRTRKTYSLKVFKAYYEADIKEGEEASPDKYIDYKVHIINIKVPKKGVDSKKKKESIEIQYTISKKSGSGKKMKVPYFYLYVLAADNDGDEHRKIYSYYTPKKAKLKSKGYDVASIISRVLDFSRPELRIENMDARNQLMGKTVKMVLTGMADRKVLAWHLEVWGNKEKVYEKSSIESPERGIGKNWWKRSR